MEYKISDDQNIVNMDADGSNHEFKEAPSDIEDYCFICSLQEPCVKFAGRDGFADFPFPCLDRNDNKNGYFHAKAE